MPEEAGFAFEQVPQQILAFGVGGLHAAEQVSNGFEAALLEVFSDPGGQGVLRTIQENSPLALDEQTQFREFVVQHTVGGRLVRPAGPAEIEPCVHSKE